MRLHPALIHRVDALAVQAGITRSEWCAQAIARAAVRAVAPQPVEDPGTSSTTGS